MKISKNWLNEWIDLSAKSADEICVALNEIGLEVDSCEHKEVPKGVVVAKVLECVEHENSDHLHVCKVDTGKEILQIVCGAPNVAAGQIVACACEGAKIGEIVIKKAKLRGVESNGMLCSARELGLGELNNGIMVLDSSIGELELGKELREFSAFNDDIIEIELTANRGDCLSILGVARDLSAKFDISVKDAPTMKKSEDDALGIGRLFSLHSDELKNSNLLYKALKISENLKLDLVSKLRLLSIESKAKTTLGGALDYISHSTGVIFRGYDAAKLGANEDEKIAIKVSSTGDESKIFANEKLISIAGIWQDEKFAVDENTKIAIIEASYSDPNLIMSAISQNKEQPKDEILYKSMRGSEPNLTLGMSLLFGKFFANEQIYGGSQQVNSQKERENILVNTATIAKMIGLNIDKKEIHRILSRLNFEIIGGENTDESFYVKVPNYRHDIANVGDICEEIVRIYGIDNIPAKALSFSEKNRINEALIKHENAKKIRQNGANTGYFECVHYVFDDGKELEILGFKPCKAKLLNPITNELSELKPTLLNALLNSALNNAKRGFKSIKLFEYGEVFNENGEQISKLAFVLSGLKQNPSLINGAKGANADLFDFANDIQKILGKIELKASDEVKFLSPFEQAWIYQNGVKIGFLGRLKPEIKKDLPKSYVCEIDFDKLKFQSVIASGYSQYPAISRDISVLIDESIKFSAIKEAINSLKIAELKSFAPTDLYSDASLRENKSLTIALEFQSSEKTLTDDEINAFMDKILGILKSDLGLELR